MFALIKVRRGSNRNLKKCGRKLCMLDFSPPDSYILHLVFHLRFVITSVCCLGEENINQVGLTYAFVFVAEL